MKKYRVYLNAVVSTSVDVEAEDGEAAVEAAFSKGVPGLMFLDHTYPDVGDWGTPSDFDPKNNKREDDYMQIGEEG